MKLMSYNILDGAVTTFDEIVEIVKSENPDYLTLNEANTFAADGNKRLRDFALLTGFPYFDIALSGEFDYHVAVLSKFQLNNVVKLQPLARACLISNIDTPVGKLSMASLHLTPLTEDISHPEIDLILKSQENSEMKVLMGDLNSLSPHDEYDESIVGSFNPGQLIKFTSQGKLRFDAIEKIESLGYMDTAVLTKNNHKNTVPTASSKDKEHATMRLDYIFVSENLVPKVEKYRVVKNELTEGTSDHYPIVVEIK